MTYDDTNIFAKILRGEIPAHSVYEDDAPDRLHGRHAAGRRATRLVIPKAPSRNMLDADPDEPSPP